MPSPPFGPEGNSANSSKVSLIHGHTYQPDDAQKKQHRDVGEVVAGLFSRKKKSRRAGDDNDAEDGVKRTGSRDGPGSEASSLLFDGDDDR